MNIYISFLHSSYVFFTVLWCKQSHLWHFSCIGAQKILHSCCFPLLTLSSSHIRHWGLNCQVRMTEISSCHHLLTAPCVYQPCVLPWPGEHNRYFYIKRDMDKARDSTQDVRLDAWHCFPQTMKCAYVVYTVLASCLHPQHERKGVVPFVSVWSWFLSQEKTYNRPGYRRELRLQPPVLTKDRSAEEMSQTVGIWRVSGRCSPAHDVQETRCRQLRVKRLAK